MVQRLGRGSTPMRRSSQATARAPYWARGLDWRRRRASTINRHSSAGVRGVRGSRTSPCPRPVSRLLVVARHPLANPTAGSAQRGGDGLWALSLSAPPDRLLAQLLLGQTDPPRSTERGDGRRNGVLRLEHLLERNDVLWAKPCQGGTMSCGPHRNDVLRALT